MFDPVLAIGAALVVLMMVGIVWLLLAYPMPNDPYDVE